MFKERIEKAYNIGKQDFIDGKKAIPAHSTKLMDFLKSLELKEMGDSVPFMKAWIKTWHTENLKI